MANVNAVVRAGRRTRRNKEVYSKIRKEKGQSPPSNTQRPPKIRPRLPSKRHCSSLCRHRVVAISAHPRLDQVLRTHRQRESGAHECDHHLVLHNFVVNVQDQIQSLYSDDIHSQQDSIPTPDITPLHRSDTNYSHHHHHEINNTSHGRRCRCILGPRSYPYYYIRLWHCHGGSITSSHACTWFYHLSRLFFVMGKLGLQRHHEIHVYGRLCDRSLHTSGLLGVCHDGRE